MCGDNFPYYLSDCCGACATEPGFPDSDICSKCNKYAEFYDKRDDNKEGEYKMRLKELSPDKYIKSAADWEEIPDEDLFEDGEITLDKTVEKIKYHLFNEGDWKLIRRTDEK